MNTEGRDPHRYVPPGNGGTLLYRVGEIEKDILILQRKVDRLLWALVTLTLSLAGSAVIFAVTVLSLRSGA
jgi:hypothetical protein